MSTPPHLCRRGLLLALVPLVVATSATPASPETSPAAATEPNVEIAKTWWPPLRNVWTPVGWKNHFFRFNVIYNGTIVGQPHIERRRRKDTAPWYKDSVQLTFTPSADGQVSFGPDLQPVETVDTEKTDRPNLNARIPPRVIPPAYELGDGPDRGLGLQSWDPAHPTPVLRTHWPISKDFWTTTMGGIVLQQEVFGHVPGARDVQTGIEPLYAWIRLSVTHVDELKAPEKFSFIVHIGNVNIARHRVNNLTVYPDLAHYQRELAAEKFTEDGKSGYRFLEDDGRVRFAALPAAPGVHAFLYRELCPLNEGMIYGSKEYYLRVTLPAKKGAHADLLLPMIPGARAGVDAEMNLGFESALAESDRYWSVKPATAAVVDTPEDLVNKAVEYSLKFSELVAEKNPHTGDYSFHLGSWYYDVLWASSCVPRVYGIFDTLGYHQAGAKYLEIFRKNQGSVKPPGPAYAMHPGYYSTPKNLTAIDWLSDHGEILEAVCRHALRSGDREFIARWQDSVIKACEFIADARKITGHDGVPGLMPPAVATDRLVATQEIKSDAACYEGLVTAVRLLRMRGHPRAEEFAVQARSYRDAFQKAYRQAAEKMPQWTDAQGRKHRLAPASLSPGGDVFHHFYLDSGPMNLIGAGLVDADDPLMHSTVEFFRTGPNTSIHDPRGLFAQRPILVHEISSAQIKGGHMDYSWKLGDRQRWLEGLYGMLTGGMSDQTYIQCEHRNNIWGLVRHHIVEDVALSVIDDHIVEDELHLLRLTPKAWFRSDYLTRFEKIATEFGPVTLTFKLTDAGQNLEVHYQPKFRQTPKRVVLHAPPVTWLQRITVNGKAFAVKAGETVNLE
ncbi:MAG: hypothetical protein HY736_08890 [Verrucomicrobia bacterium]|nr:hypothetical protein [Verrucomicrobiota bacterium]